MTARRYRIGEFARLAGASIKALRFYDELGLLRPAEVDARTRYRYYHVAQLQELAAIRALQDLGASLADIQRVMVRGTMRSESGGGERRRLLARLRARALRTLESTHRSLQWIEFELDDPGHEASIPVVLKERNEVRIASIRASLRCYADIDPVERSLCASLRPGQAGDLRGVLWHRCEASGGIEGEPFVELRGRAPQGVELKHLPRARVASAYCEPEDEAAVRTYEAIDRWIHRHSLRLNGPKRELYMGQLLEIQFPVSSV